MLLGITLAIVLCLPNGYAISYINTTTSFNDVTNPFYKNLTAYINSSNILDIPTYSNVKNVTLSILLNETYENYNYSIYSPINFADASYSGYVMRGKLGNIIDNATQIKIKFSSHTTAGNYNILQYVYIGEIVGNNLRNVTNIKNITFFNNGSITFGIPTNSYIYSDVLNYTIDKNKNYSITAFAKTPEGATSSQISTTENLSVGTNNLTVERLADLDWSDDSLNYYTTQYVGATEIISISNNSNLTIYLSNNFITSTILKPNDVFNYSFDTNTLNNLLHSNNYLNFSFLSEINSNIYLNLVNASYEYGIDNCTVYNNSILNISYFDEISLGSISLLNDYGITFKFSDTNKITLYNSTTATKTNFCSLVNLTNLYNISAYGSMSLSKSGYTSKIYQNDETNSFNLVSPFPYMLNLYLLNSGNTSTTTLTIKNQLSARVIEGVQAYLYEIVSGTPILVESRISDVGGNVIFNYLADKWYRMVFIKDGYITLTQDFNPIQSATYTVYLVPSSSSSVRPNLDNLLVSFNPKSFANGYSYNFTMSIVSPYSELDSYGYKLTYPSSVTSATGTTAEGETLTSAITISGASYYDKLYVDWYYVVDGENRSFTDVYTVTSNTTTNNTMVNPNPNFDSTYGMGLFERMLIITIIILLVVGIASMIGQPLMGGIVGLFLLIYFTYIGFISSWYIIPSIFIGLLIVSSRSQ